MCNKKENSLQGGFIALISAILISGILISLVITSSHTGFSVRMDSLNRELKEQSYNLADSCVSSALLQMQSNYLYTPKISGNVISLGNDVCMIDSVTYNPEDPVSHTKSATVYTRAGFRGTWTRIKTTVSLSSPVFSHSPPVPNVIVISKEEI